MENLLFHLEHVNRAPHSPQMHSTMARLLQSVNSVDFPEELIEWASPVPFFGRLDEARVATVGINPSNLEFVDGSGRELLERDRRLPTLETLGIATWQEAGFDQIEFLLTDLRAYFARNPYRRWFDVLDRAFKGSGYSYYHNHDTRPLCHLDLVPFATSQKWGSLRSAVRRNLMEHGRQSIAEFIRESNLDVLVLNGRSVVTEFESFAEVRLTAETRTAWSLPRRNGDSVRGLLYHGIVRSMGDVDLGRSVRVLGYNHNLQSSFGVTSAAVRAIGEFLGDQIADSAHRQTL